MKIEKIEIENFRGYKGKHTLEFDSHINVFVGFNGAGKSSILDLIAMFIDALLKDVHNDFLGYELSQFDVNSESQSTQNEIFFSDESNIFKKDYLNFSLNFHRTEKPELTLTMSEKVGPFVEFFDEILNKRANIPIFRYFCTDSPREDNSSKELRKEYLTYIQTSVYNRFYSNRNNFNDFMSWFITQENVENRDKIRLKNFGHEDKFLKPVRDSLNKFLLNFKSLNLSNIRVENSIKIFNIISPYYLEIEKNGKTLSVGQLSSGEKTILFMVADIAQKISTANPSLPDPLQGTGIVLIDEIDTHLHPAWQREVLPCLHKTFPNIQFFATTHSPQVLSNIDRKNIILIEDFEFKKPSFSFGKDSNSILHDIFGVSERPEEAQRDFDELYALIDDPKKEAESKQKLLQMEQKYGFNDPEIQRAQMHFEFLTANE